MWMAKDFSLSIDWNYFATSHGKCPVDGIGGNVKRFAEKIVRQRNFIVSNAHEFHAAVLGLQNIKTFCVLKKNVFFHIKKWIKDINLRCPPIKGVSNTHMSQNLSKFLIH